MQSCDVPCSCNLVVCDLLDDGLLTSGIIPAVSHALNHLALTDALVVPAAISVRVQAVQVEAAKAPCGITLAALDRYRWLPGPSPCRLPAPKLPGLGGDSSAIKPSIVALSGVYDCWHFDLRSPPDSADRKHVDLEFTADGHWNA